MTIQRLFLVCAGLILCSGMLFGTGQKESADKEDVVKVGVAHALTGAIALYGEPIVKGIELAVEQMNEQDYIGEGKKIQLIIEDTVGDKKQAINVFEKLIKSDGVSAILGPTLSNSAFAADPIAQENGIPVIGSSNTATGITDMGEFVFRTSLPESAVIPNTIAKLIEKRNLSRVALMYGSDDQFTKSGYDVFDEVLRANNIDIVSVETFSKGDTDFSPQLTKINTLNPQAIVASALAEEAANIMIQAGQQGMSDIYIVGGNGFNSPKLAGIAGPAAEGAISGAAWFISNPSEANTRFVDTFRDKYGADPDQFAAQAYTAARALGEAIRRAGSADPGKIRDALAEIKDLSTPLGSFGFDENRDPDHEPVVLIVKEGTFSLFQD